jgi:ribose 5-phosphate isomerase B
MKIALGSDHAGVRYKLIIGRYLKSLGHDVHDLGPYTETPAVDYPQYIRPVAERVASGEFERGIVLGGSGNGEAIVANRVKGIRCGLCWNVESAQLTREHNNANIISLGQRMVSEETAIEIVKAFLDTPFGGGRHERRIKAIDAA